MESRQQFSLQSQYVRRAEPPQPPLALPHCQPPSQPLSAPSPTPSSWADTQPLLWVLRRAQVHLGTMILFQRHECLQLDWNSQSSRAVSSSLSFPLRHPLPTNELLQYPRVIVTITPFSRCPHCRGRAGRGVGMSLASPVCLQDSPSASLCPALCSVPGNSRHSMKVCGLDE